MTETALAGARVLLLASPRRHEMTTRLVAAGADVDQVDVRAIESTPDADILESAVLAWCAGDADWLVAVSPYAIEACDRIARSHGTTLAQPQPDAKVAVAGAHTLKACQRAGLTVDLEPERRATARAVADAFPEGEGTVLAFGSEDGSTAVAAGLGAKGWTVREVQAYSRAGSAGLGRTERAALAEGGVDVVVLASAAAVALLAPVAHEVASGVRVIAVGEAAEVAARDAGLEVAAVAPSTSIDATIAGIARGVNPDADVDPQVDADADDAAVDVDDVLTSADGDRGLVPGVEVEPDPGWAPETWPDDDLHWAGGGGGSD